MFIFFVTRGSRLLEWAGWDVAKLHKCHVMIYFISLHVPLILIPCPPYPLKYWSDSHIKWTMTNFPSVSFSLHIPVAIHHEAKSLDHNLKCPAITSHLLYNGRGAPGSRRWTWIVVENRPIGILEWCTIHIYQAQVEVFCLIYCTDDVGLHHCFMYIWWTSDYVYIYCDCFCACYIYFVEYAILLQLVPEVVFCNACKSLSFEPRMWTAG